MSDGPPTNTNALEINAALGRMFHQGDTDVTVTRSPTIALCMIVKDEEKRLPDSLRSTLPLVDEVVVVDTGSTDKTLEILAEARREWFDLLGKKGKFLILHRPWDDNFSAARNYGIERATADWILQIDADEVIDQATGPLLREAAERGLYGDLKGTGCFFFDLRNIMTDGRQSAIQHPHLFRRVGVVTGTPFRFEGLVHNRPLYEGPATCCPMVIRHYGYGEDPETMRRKHERRKVMVGKWLDEEPDGFWPHFYSAQTWASELGEEAEANTIYHSRRALELISKYPQIPQSSGARCYYGWMLVLMRAGKAEELLSVCQEAINVLPWYPDSYFFLAWAHCTLGHWEECFQACTEFFDFQERAQQPQEAVKFVGVENLTMDHGPLVVGFWRHATHKKYGMEAPATLVSMPVIKVGGLEATVPEEDEVDLAAPCAACAL